MTDTSKDILIARLYGELIGFMEGAANLSAYDLKNVPGDNLKLRWRREAAKLREECDEFLQRNQVT